MANEKRLIDYEQAKRATYEEIFWSESEQAVVRHFLAKLPKVDAVEVVRCKECVSGMYFPHTEKCWCKAPFGMVGNTPVDPNGFCSYGERKEERT